MEDLISGGMSIRQMGESAGCSMSSVRHWMRKFGLKTKHEQYNKKRGSHLKRCRHCGETDVGLFCKSQDGVCRRCDSKRSVEFQHSNRNRIIDRLGGKCSECGFSRFKSALHAHHIDPSKKDPMSHHMRRWAWERVEREISKCILLCSNCHSGLHSGELILKGG